MKIEKGAERLPFSVGVIEAVVQRFETLPPFGQGRPCQPLQLVSGGLLPRELVDSVVRQCALSYEARCDLDDRSYRAIHSMLAFKQLGTGERRRTDKKAEPVDPATCGWQIPPNDGWHGYSGWQMHTVDCGRHIMRAPGADAQALGHGFAPHLRRRG